MKSVTQLQTSRKRLNRSHLLSTITKKALPILLVLLFVAQIISPFIVSAQSNTISGPLKANPTEPISKEISTWKELMGLGTVETIDGVKTAVISSGNYTVKLKEDLVACCAIKVTGTANVHILADENSPKTIYRQDENTNFTLFTVESGGKLTLGDNVTLTGDVAKTYNKVYKITVTDGYGTTLYETTVNDDETRTPLAILQKLGIADQPNKQDAINFIAQKTGPEIDPDSPYSLGYKFVQWDMAGMRGTPMKDVGGDLLIAAKWDNPDKNKKMYVVDGYGNEIYSVEVLANSTKTPRDLLTDANINDEVNPNNNIETLLRQKLSEVNGPFKLGYKFNGWDLNYDEEEEKQFKDISGDFYVVAKWITPYKITLTDGYGTVLDTITVNSDEHETPQAILEGRHYYTRDEALALIARGTENISDSPYKLGFELKTNGYHWDMAGQRTKYMDTEVRGDLLIAADWNLELKVTDGAGNVIFRSSDKSKPIRQLMLDKGLNPDATSGNADQKAVISSKIDQTDSSPANDNNYTFEGWLSGDVDLNDSLSNIGGNVVVCADWKANSNTDYTWGVPDEIVDGRTFEIGVNGSFLGIDGTLTSWTNNYNTDNQKWMFTNVETNGNETTFEIVNYANQSLKMYVEKQTYTPSIIYADPTSGYFNYKSGVSENILDNYRTRFMFITNDSGSYLACKGIFSHTNYSEIEKTVYAIREQNMHGDQQAVFFSTRTSGSGGSMIHAGTPTKDYPNPDTPGKTVPGRGKDTPGVSAPAYNNPTDVPGTTGHDTPTGQVPQTPREMQSGKRTDVPNADPCETPIKKGSTSGTRYVIGDALPTKFNKNGQGFFVQVNNGGTLDIEGAVLRDVTTGRRDNNGNYINSTSVTDSAPVVVNGGTLHFTSGQIINNSVGYAADDSKSGMPVNSYSVNNTWRYVGAELGANTPGDIPTPTKTAGGIIFKNKSTGYISGSASIEQNHGDVGALLIQGNSTVYLGDDPNTTKEEDGGHIDRNVGFHYAGAVLVEDGGSLIMDGNTSTMNYNVSWNKGGAAWATEYGTYGDGFGVRIPKGSYNLNNRWPMKDDQGNVVKDAEGNVVPNPGKFVMHDGNIQYNTAFHRGGAINVESDYVELYGGDISYNNCRALGGAIYVEGDAVKYNYTLVINEGYIGHNFAVSSDPSVQNDTIDYRYYYAAEGHGYLHYKTIAEANDILDRKLRTGNDNSVGGNPTSNGTWISGTTPFENVSINPLSESDIADDTSDRVVWQGFRRGTSWEGNGGGVWLCPLGSTAVFNMNSEHEVYVDDNYATGVNSQDTRIGSDLYLMPGNGHVIAKEMDGEVWINQENGKRVPEFENNDAASRIYSGPKGFVNVTTDDNNTVNPDYSEQKAQEYDGTTGKQKDKGIKIYNNLSRNGGGIAANGTVLFGAPTNINRHEAEMELSKRWTIHTPTKTLHYEMYYDNGTNNPPQIEGYDFTLRGERQGDGEYTIVNENNPYTDPETGEVIWSAKFSIPITYADENNNVYPIYKFIDPEYPNDTSKRIDPSTQEGTDRILELLTRTTNPITKLDVDPDSWKLILVEKDNEGKIISNAVFKAPVVMQFDAKVNPIRPIGGQGQSLQGYEIKYSVATFSQEVVNTNDTVEKYINNVVHEDFYTFDDVFEYEIMAYVPVDADEVIIYDTLKKPLMFVDRNGNAQYVLQNNTLVSNSQFINGSTPNLLVSSSEYNPAFVNTFKLEPISEIVSTTYNTGYGRNFIQTNSNYYMQENNQDWTIIDWGPNAFNNNKDRIAPVTVSGNPVLHVYETNNHYGNGEGTVSKIGDIFTDPLNSNVKIANLDTNSSEITMPAANNVSGDTIYVKIDENTGIDKVRGKWVKLSFNAAIKPNYRNINALKAEGWVDDDYDKKGSPLPELTYNDNNIFVESLNDFIKSHNNNDYIIKFIKVENRIYGKVYSPDENYRYYQMNLNGDNEWYRTYRCSAGTCRINTKDGANASDGEGSFDKKNVTLDTYNHIREFFGDDKQWGDLSIKTELSESILPALDDYLSKHNDSVAVLKEYDRNKNGNDWIHVYLVKTVNGDFYQRVREVGNKTITDGIWYKTELGTNPDGSKYTKLTPLYGTELGQGEANEIDQNGNQLEGFNRVRDALNNNSIESVNLKEFRGIVEYNAGYNWPVIRATEPHSGEMNEAKYAVIKNNAQTISKSNVVTFDVVQPEKYVNNRIHEILRHDQTAEGAFDQVFEYEIMAYVPNNADEIIIWDTLRDDLMFVDRHGKTQYKTYTIGTNENNNFSELKDIPNSEFMNRTEDDNLVDSVETHLGVTLVANDGKSIDPEEDTNNHQLQYYENNNHKGDGTGTVATSGTDLNGPITNNNIVISTAPSGEVTTLPEPSLDTYGNNIGNTIYIKIDENSGIKTVKGKWVKVTFFAQIKPSRYKDIVNKLQKSTRHTNNKLEAVDYSDSNKNPTPVGYNYRTTDKTSLKLNAKGYNPANDTVPESSIVGYYAKDADTGYFINYVDTKPSTGTVGVDYIPAYESAFVYHASSLEEIPAEVRSNASEYEAVYLKKGWNDTDDSISWEKVTNDGSVVDGIKLYRDDNSKESYLDVQADGSHAGLANKANYSIRFDNEWKTTTTNTVTVVPLLRTITVKKMWIMSNEDKIPSANELLEHLHLYWERISNLENTSSDDHGKTVGEITQLYKNNISIVQEKVENVTDKTRYTWRIEIKDLPQFRPSMKYFISEDMFDGFNLPRYQNPSDPEATEHAHDTGSIINSKESEVELLVTKKWDGTVLEEHKNEKIRVQLLENGHPVWKRDSQYRVLDKDGNLATSEADAAIDPDYEKEINVEEDWFILFSPLMKYQRDLNGQIITELAKDKYGENIVISNRGGNDEYLYREKLNEYSIKVLSDPNDYILSIVNKDELQYKETTTTYIQEASDYVNNNGEKTATVIGYYLYDVNRVNEEYVIDTSSERFLTEEPQTAACTITQGLPSTPVITSCYREVYKKIETYKHFEVDLVNTKPRIEKYINKDVHLDTYFINDFTYDIMVYVPEEAKEIEITDELLPTLIFKSIDEPEISGNETKEIVGYNHIFASSIPAPEGMEVNLAVHDGNNHKIYGTVNTNSVFGNAKGTITKQGNGFKILIDNIVPYTSDYIVDSDGEYIYVKDDVGNKVYKKASDELVYYKEVSGVDASDPNSYTGKYIRYHNINTPDEYSYMLYSEYLTNYSSDTDYEIDPANKFYEKKDYLKVDNYNYRKKNEKHYVKDLHGEFIKIINTNDSNIIKYLDRTANTPTGYILDDELYSYVDSHDQRIGGKYVQVTFTSRINIDGYIEDSNGKYWLCSDDNYYLANSLPSGVNRKDDKKYSTREEALKSWVENPFSSSNEKDTLDWDVITDYNPGVDGNNKGWDKYVNKSLKSNGYQVDEEYIEKSIFDDLVEYLSNNNDSVDVIINDFNSNDEASYFVRTTNGKYYQYLNVETSNIPNQGYKELVKKWFEVEANPNSSDSISNNNAKVKDLNGEYGYNIYGNLAWLGIGYGRVVEKFNNLDTNPSSFNTIDLIPVDPDEYVMIENKYYLKEVADVYNPDYTDKTIYKKVDWGRGDGDVIREYSNNFQGNQYKGDHAGIVNTASYKVTYGNGYKSNHKSNTVTVVPHIYRLPSSGGIGTYWITILGSMFIALAINYLVNINKKRRKRGGVSG